MFNKLATECEDYVSLRGNFGGSKFHLDKSVAAFLRDEAAGMQEFIRDADSRRYGHRRWTETQLWMMMREIQMITGSFQDRLVADLVNGISGRQWNPEQLKRWRARENARWDKWTPPRYFNRPDSRIKLD